MFRRSKIIIGLVILSLAVILSLPIHSSKNIRIKIADFFSPLIVYSHHVFAKIFSIKDIFRAVKENRELKIKVEELSDRCNIARESSQENERLKQLLDFKKSLVYDSVACRVIARDVSTWYKTFIIDKGKNSGISVDMPVVTGKGVIGRIIDTDDDVSRVLLVTDVNSSIGGITQDMRIAGIVEGDGTNECAFNLISKKEDIQIGSPVITNGLSKVFPKGLMIGVINKTTESEQGLYKIAKIKLSADINRVEEVLVLKVQMTKNK